MSSRVWWKAADGELLISPQADVVLFSSFQRLFELMDFGYELIVHLLQAFLAFVLLRHKVHCFRQVGGSGASGIMGDEVGEAVGEAVFRFRNLMIARAWKEVPEDCNFGYPLRKGLAGVFLGWRSWFPLLCPLVLVLKIQKSWVSSLQM